MSVLLHPPGECFSPHVLLKKISEGRDGVSDSQVPARRHGGFVVPRVRIRANVSLHAGAANKLEFA
jgi:hypothetical protein